MDAIPSSTGKTPKRPQPRKRTREEIEEELERTAGIPGAIHWGIRDDEIGQARVGVGGRTTTDADVLGLE